MAKEQTTQALQEQVKKAGDALARAESEHISAVKSGLNVTVSANLLKDAEKSFEQANAELIINEVKKTDINFEMSKEIQEQQKEYQLQENKYYVLELNNIVSELKDWSIKFMEQSDKDYKAIIIPGVDADKVNEAKNDNYNKLVDSFSDKIRNQTLGNLENITVSYDNDGGTFKAERAALKTDEERADYDKKYAGLKTGVVQIANVQASDLKSLLYAVDDNQKADILRIQDDLSSKGKTTDEIQAAIMVSLQTNAKTNQLLADRLVNYERNMQFGTDIMNTSMNKASSMLDEFGKDMRENGEKVRQEAMSKQDSEVKIYLRSVQNSAKDVITDDLVVSLKEDKWKISQDPQDQRFYTSTSDQKMNLALVNQDGEKLYGRFSYNDMLVLPTANGMAVSFYSFKDSEITSDRNEFERSLNKAIGGNTMQANTPMWTVPGVSSEIGGQKNFLINSGISNNSVDSPILTQAPAAFKVELNSQTTSQPQSEQPAVSSPPAQLSTSASVSAATEVNESHSEKGTFTRHSQSGYLARQPDGKTGTANSIVYTDENGKKTVVAENGNVQDKALMDRFNEQEKTKTEEKEKLADITKGTKLTFSGTSYSDQQKDKQDVTLDNATTGLASVSQKSSEKLNSNDIKTQSVSFSDSKIAEFLNKQQSTSLA